MFGWLFGKKKQDPVFKAEIVETKREKKPYVDRSEEFMPAVHEVLGYAPDPIGMTPERLADLVSRDAAGLYIKVGEYPEGIDRDYIRNVIIRVRRWHDWTDRAEGMIKGSNSVVPRDHRFSACKVPCKRAAKLNGKVFRGDKAVRIPLRECWQHCLCMYVGERRR